MSRLGPSGRPHSPGQSCRRPAIPRAARRARRRAGHPRPAAPAAASLVRRGDLGPPGPVGAERRAARSTSSASRSWARLTATSPRPSSGSSACRRGRSSCLPVLLALATVALTVRLAHDAFGARAALFAAALLAVPPDFLLFWSHEARNHYPLTLLLGTLALLLALRAPAARGGRATLLFALLGGMPGARVLDQLPLARLFPGDRAPARAAGAVPLVPRALVALPAFLLGSLPHWLYGVPHGTAMPPPGRPVGLGTVLAHLGFFGRTAWPIVAGVPHAVRDAPLGVALALAIGALYLMAALKPPCAPSGGRPHPRGRRAWPWWSLCAPTWASLRDAVRARPRRQRPALPPAALLGAAAAARVVPGRARGSAARAHPRGRAPPGPRARRARRKLRQSPPGHRGGRARRARRAARDRGGPRARRHSPAVRFRRHGPGVHGPLGRPDDRLESLRGDSTGLRARGRRRPGGRLVDALGARRRSRRTSRRSARASRSVA